MGNTAGINGAASTSGKPVSKKVCKICSLIGSDYTNHSMADCFCNPMSLEYRPMVQYRRIMAALKNNIEPPAWVLEMAPFTAGSPPGGHRPATNSVMTPEAEETLRNMLS